VGELEKLNKRGVDYIVSYDGRTGDKVIGRCLPEKLGLNHIYINGVFITEQVGGNNDRDLVEMVLPETEKPFPHLNLAEQRKSFETAGFHILRAEETYRPIKFYDIGAFVWFAHVIEWEFPDFSVDKCFEHLLKMQEMIDKEGKIEGTIHRYLIVARK
jgi:hypothetical protein